MKWGFWALGAVLFLAIFFQCFARPECPQGYRDEGGGYCSDGRGNYVEKRVPLFFSP